MTLPLCRLRPLHLFLCHHRCRRALRPPSSRLRITPRQVTVKTSGGKRKTRATIVLRMSSTPHATLAISSRGSCSARFFRLPASRRVPILLLQGRAQHRRPQLRLHYLLLRRRHRRRHLHRLRRLLLQLLLSLRPQLPRGVAVRYSTPSKAVRGCARLSPMTVARLLSLDVSLGTTGRRLTLVPVQLFCLLLKRRTRKRRALIQVGSQ